MDWLKIISAATIIGLMILIFPAMRHSMKNTRKASKNEWISVIIPIGLVVVFVYLLTKMV